MAFQTGQAPRLVRGVVFFFLVAISARHIAKLVAIFLPSNLFLAFAHSQAALRYAGSGGLPMSVLKAGRNFGNVYDLLIGLIAFAIAGVYLEKPALLEFLDSRRYLWAESPFCSKCHAGFGRASVFHKDPKCDSHELDTYAFKCRPLVKSSRGHSWAWEYAPDTGVLLPTDVADSGPSGEVRTSPVGYDIISAFQWNME